MTTEKQMKANKENALVSTGPVTAKGKALVSRNAVKHGIFAKDIIIVTGDGKEDERQYRELLDGLITSLNPSGRMECLLVEKIAVDYWRLRRVLRFETGSTRNILDMAISDYYDKRDYFGKKERKGNDEIDEEISTYKDKQGKASEERIAELKRQKLKNKLAEEVTVKIGSLPPGEDWEKVIKYEKAVQRSILQNLALLKRLQAMR